MPEAGSLIENITGKVPEHVKCIIKFETTTTTTGGFFNNDLHHVTTG